MSTLQEAAEALKPLLVKRPRNARIAAAWLGRFPGVVPTGKTSTEFLRELRRTLHGKSR